MNPKNIVKVLLLSAAAATVNTAVDKAAPRDPGENPTIKRLVLLCAVSVVAVNYGAAWAERQFSIKPIGSKA